MTNKATRRVCKLGDDLVTLDAATHYQGSITSQGVHLITGRTPCAVCGSVIEIKYARSAFASFFSKHLKCNQDYFQKNGHPPEGVGAAEIESANWPGNLISFGRPSEMLRMARSLAQAHKGRIIRTWNCTGTPADVSFGITALPPEW